MPKQLCNFGFPTPRGKSFLETQVTNGQEIDVQDLAQGVYFLQLYDNSTQRQNTYKLIKNKPCFKKTAFFSFFYLPCKASLHKSPKDSIPSHSAEPDRRVAHERIRGHKISYCTRHGTKQSSLLRISLRVHRRFRVFAFDDWSGNS